MKNYRFICLFLLFSLLFTSIFPVFAQDERVLPSGISYDDIGSEIEAYVEDNKDTTAGLAVSVFDSNGVIYENYFGFANIDDNIPVDEDTVFEWDLLLSYWFGFLLCSYMRMDL